MTARAKSRGSVDTLRLFAACCGRDVSRHNRQPNNRLQRTVRCAARR